jgi:serine/threonine-protein kinase HipA
LCTYVHIAAHAKNYSVLLSGAQVRLGPLYYVASALAYDDIYPPKLKMAMRIGTEHGMEAVAGRHWRRLAGANDLDPDETLATVADVVQRIPDAFVEAVRERAVRQLRSKLPHRVMDRIAERAERCRAQLDR